MIKNSLFFIFKLKFIMKHSRPYVAARVFHSSKGRDLIINTLIAQNKVYS